MSQTINTNTNASTSTTGVPTYHPLYPPQYGNAYGVAADMFRYFDFPVFNGGTQLTFDPSTLALVDGHGSIQAKTRGGEVITRHLTSAEMAEYERRVAKADRDSSDHTGDGQSWLHAD